MKMIHRMAALSIGAAVILAGCASPQAEPVQRLDAHAPAAAGLPAPPAPGEPAPLTLRPPFGLYAHPPGDATLEALAAGPESPDGRFRAALTDEGAWVTRVDGAWFWQVQLPPAPPPPPDEGGAAPPRQEDKSSRQAPEPQPEPVRPVPPLRWTGRSTLLLRGEDGGWYEADPHRAQVAPLPSALQDKEMLQFSPDGSRVLYYVNGEAGKELWVARATGEDARLLGTNVTGWWDRSGNPVVHPLAADLPPSWSPDRAPDLDWGGLPQ